MDNLESLKSEITDQVAAASDLDALEQARIAALGKKGRVTELMKGLGNLPPDERKEAGQALNALKSDINAREHIEC